MSEETQPTQDTPDVGEILYGKNAEGEEQQATEQAEQPKEQKLDAKSEDNASAEQSDGDDKSENKTDDAPSDEQQEQKSEELKLERPEGSDLTDEHLKEVEAFAKDKGLSKEVAEQVLEMQDKLMKKYKEGAAESLKEVSQAWYDSASQDKEYGGEQFGKNIELAKRAVDRFATDAFKEDLDRTGFGNHPELLRVFYRIGKAMGDGEFVRPGAQAKRPKTYEEIFYGGSNNN